MADQGSLINVYDPAQDGPAHIRIPGMTQLTLSSISNVCHTDEKTVALVFNEIITKVEQLGKNGHNIRLNFKVGYLCLRGNLVYWRQ